MNAAQLSHGDIKEVADYMNTKNGVTQDELHSALINALNRVHQLEKQVAKLQEANQPENLWQTIRNYLLRTYPHLKTFFQVNSV